MQRLGIMSPRIWKLAKNIGLKMVDVIRPLLLNPLSDVVKDIRLKEPRENCTTWAIYAGYNRKDMSLRKIGLTSNLKRRKELCYNHNPGVVIRMIFHIDGMPREMDEKVTSLYF